MRPVEFETLPALPHVERGRWRPDHDGGDEDASIAGSDFDASAPVPGGILVRPGTFDWLINHPHSPRNLKPVMILCMPRTEDL